MKSHLLEKKTELNSGGDLTESTPILIVCYARPHSTAMILEAVLASRPNSHVYVSLDGVKELADSRVLRLRGEVVEVVEKFYPSLDITFINRQQNLGTNRNIEAAIETVFLEHDRVVVVEDDCLPSASFFDFCDWGLNRFRSSASVLMIQGANHFRWPLNSLRGNHMLSQLSHVWGWATWRDKWESPSEINRSLRSATRQDLMMTLSRKLPFARYRKAWLKFWDSEKEMSWDISLQFRIWREDLLVVCPGINLVRNIGFDSVASNSNAIPDHFQNATGRHMKFPPQILRVPISALTFMELWSLRRFAISRTLRMFAINLLSWARQRAMN